MDQVSLPLLNKCRVCVDPFLVNLGCWEGSVHLCLPALLLTRFGCLGFILSYFMIPFVEGGGAIRAFSILAGLCAAAFIIVPILQVFGQRLRTISGDLPQALRQPKCTSQYVTPEQRPTNAELKAEEEFRE